MRTYLSPFVAVLATAILISCSNSNSDSPTAIANKWCSLNAKVHQADTDEEKQKAEKTLDDFENEMDKKYDEAFIKKAKDEIEKCEEASEGR